MDRKRSLVIFVAALAVAWLTCSFANVMKRIRGT